VWCLSVRPNVEVIWGSWIAQQMCFNSSGILPVWPDAPGRCHGARLRLFGGVGVGLRRSGWPPANAWLLWSRFREGGLPLDTFIDNHA